MAAHPTITRDPHAVSAVPTDAVATHVRVATATDAGLVRGRNEDACIALDLVSGRAIASSGEITYAPAADLLLAVADGMGGHAHGDVASALAVRELTASVASDILREGAVRLRDGVLHAHAQVSSLAANERGRRRMGTTLTAVHVDGGRAHVAHVGDSRAYVLRAERLEPLTRDHSYTQMLVENDILCPDTVDLSPFPGTLLQVIGQAQPIQVDVASFDLRDDDWLVLCSDGLTQHVKDPEIAAALLASGGPDAAARALIGLALRGGGTDNVTVVVAALTGGLRGRPQGEPFAATYRALESYEPPPASWRAIGGLE